MLEHASPKMMQIQQVYFAAATARRASTLTR